MLAFYEIRTVSTSGWIQQFSYSVLEALLVQNPRNYVYPITMNLSIDDVVYIISVHFCSQTGKCSYLMGRLTSGAA